MKKAIFTAGVLFFLVGRAFCAELLVPSQYPTIQAAIDAAANGDTVIIAPGTYSDIGNQAISISGKVITVRSTDPNNPSVVDSTIIDCCGLSVGFYINSSSVLDGLKIINGSGSDGGCIYVNPGSYPLIRNCNVRNNNANGFGGGVYSDGYLTIVGCRISKNHSAYGGGLSCYVSSSSISVIDCNISENSADYGGGGIFSSAGAVKVNRSVISGNFSDSGGAVSSGNLNISDSIISANFAQGYGGGLIGLIRAQGCTIAGNGSVLSGGGVYLGSSGSSSFFTDCILWGNSDSSGTGLTAQITSSSPPTVIFSCIQDDAPNDSDIPFGGEPNGNIDDDPMFVREPNDGGDGWGVGNNDDYGDLHLKLNSPCIEKGNPYYLNAPSSTDIDGQPRVMGRFIDVGADEYAPIIAVTRPKAGEVWATSSKRKIEWTGYGVSSVNILLSEDNGANWETIANDLADTNSYLWEVPDFVESSQCVISVVPGDSDVNVLVIKSGLFTVDWYPQRPSVPPEWKHRGLLPGPNLSENTGPKFGCIKWGFDTNGPVTSQVAVTRPYWNSYGVYIGCEDGNIYALDDQGEFFWSFDINTPIVGSPAVGYYDMVYVAGQNGWLYAIDDYGDPRWTFTTKGPFYSTPVVGYSGIIYVCSEDGVVYAIDANGSDLWTFSIGQAQNKAAAIFASPLIEKNGAVYVAGLYDANLYALDSNTGSVKWVCDFNMGLLFAAPAVGPDGTIYQTLVYDTNLYAVDSNNGDILWKTNLADPCVDWYGEDYSTKFPSAYGWNTPAVGPDGTIYVCLDDIFLRAVKPDGTIKWVTRLGELGWFTISVANNGLIYVAGDDGFVCVVDPNGKEVSRFKGDGWVTYPAIVEDGTLIVSDANNRVWAITNTPCDELPPVLHSPADTQPSWMVDLIDFALLADNWLQCTDPANESCSEGILLYGTFAPGDINRDLYVDYWDIADMSDRWLTGAN